MYRILVADDEPIERSVVSKKIQTFFPDQFEIVLAENGREAVSLFREKECQIALLDIEMPGMNGLEAAASIRAEDDYACIIFLTAFDEFDYAKKAITLRALDYLLKPGNDVELITAIEEAVREVEKLKSQPPENRKETPGNTLCAEELGNVRVKAVAERILSYIDANYAQDISMQDAARAMGYADAYFCKIFKESFDKSFMVYLADYRMEKAKELLEDMTVNIKDVGSSVGYRDSNYFTKVFKRIVGVTPTEYRTQKLM
ncbi:MAG: response regulator [Lachnospiraceae bacterium]|nr:response regulator [Lachnospiraceae bacterium]